MLNDSDPKRVKSVLQAMIDEIRVDARDQIDLTFRVPAVRIESVSWSQPDSMRTTLRGFLAGGCRLDEAWTRWDDPRSVIERRSMVWVRAGFDRVPSRSVGLGQRSPSY